MHTQSVGEISGYGPGFYLAFATSPGSTAADGNGARNSPFTAARLQALLPDDQVSWTNHSIKGSCILVPSGNQPPSVNRPAAVPSVLVMNGAEIGLDTSSLVATIDPIGASVHSGSVICCGSWSYIAANRPRGLSCLSPQLWRLPGS